MDALPLVPSKMFSVRRSLWCRSLWCFFASIIFLTASATGTTYYWDINGNGSGSGGPSPSGVWDTNNTANWTPSSGGATNNGNDVKKWTSGFDAVFSANTDATGAYTITVTGAVTANSIDFQEGTITLSGASSPSLILGAGGMTVESTINGNVSLDSTIPVFISATEAWTNNSNKVLSVAGAVKSSATTGTQTLTLTGSGGSTFGAVTVSGVISDGTTGGHIAVTASSSGTVTLGGNNRHSGVTQVTAGTLLINGNQSSANGTVTVGGSGTILGGTGTIGGATTINGPAGITGATNGTVGTLTLSSNLTFSGSAGNLATCFVDLSGATSDKLAIGVALNISSAFDKISFSGSTNGTTTYILATFASNTSNGTFDSVVNLPTGYHLVYNATDIELAPVPEPSTWLAAGLAVPAIGYTQRRRVGSLLRRTAELSVNS